MLYTAFTPYPLRTITMRNGKPCPDDNLLRSLPLEQLTWHELRRYPFKAMSLWGDSHNYRHFLPRLLELLAIAPPHFNEEVIFYNINYEWRAWPLAEQKAIEAYLAALWHATLHAFDPAQPQCWVADPLCCIGQVMDDLGSYLRAWEGHASRSAARLLAAYLAQNRDMLLLHDKLENPYWSSRQPQMRQVIDWLFAPTTTALLEEAFLAAAYAPYSGEFADALDVLNGLR